MMITLLFTALLWCGIMGQLSWGNTLCGALLGLVIDLRLRRMIRPSDMPTSQAYLRALVILPQFLIDLVKANLVMAREVFRPARELHPGFIVIPVDPISPLEATTATHWITLTPGTMTVDVDLEGGYVVVHAMQAESPNQVRESLLQGPIRQTRSIFRS